MRKIHGLSRTRFYDIWRGVKLRCYNEKRKDYSLYGGLGIEVSEEWKTFINFKNDMYESYIEHVEKYGEKETTLDRMNSKGNYEAENCRWATIAEQLANRKPYKRASGLTYKTRKTVMTKTFIAIDPNGVKYQGSNQRVFSEEHNLNQYNINACLNGRRKHHKQWTFKYLED